MEVFKVFGAIVAILVVVFGIAYGIGFLATGGDLMIYKFFAPKMEEARREVFEQTPSYVQGKNTYIARLRLEYETAEGEQKEALRRLILTEAETIDEENLTPANRSFVYGLRSPFPSPNSR